MRGGGKSVYFVGDTGYNPHTFKEVGERLGPFDLALVPIGAYAPRWFMHPQHVDPAEAVEIHDEVGARRSLAMHWGTFPLTAERPDEPPKLLEEALRAKGLDAESFLAVAIGSTTQIGG